MKANWYKISLGLLVAMQIQNATGELIPLQEVLESFQKTHLPVSLLPWLVITKILAAVALLLPGWYLVKEWAFAGILIDILGAFFSYLLAGSYTATGLYLVPAALGVWALAYYQFRRHAGDSHLPPVPHQRLYRWLAYPFAVMMLVLGAGELAGSQPVMVSLQRLDYPAQGIFILGSAKILGALAILIPSRLLTLKHWAYAGFAYDFIGALYLYFANGYFLVVDVGLLIGLLLWELLAYRFFFKTDKDAFAFHAG
jgi:uncharacterized membrane protein